MTANDVTLWVDMPGVLFEIIAAHTAEGETVEEWLADPRNLRLGEFTDHDPGGTEIYTDGEIVIQYCTEGSEQ